VKNIEDLNATIKQLEQQQPQQWREQGGDD